MEADGSPEGHYDYDSLFHGRLELGAFERRRFHAALCHFSGDMFVCAPGTVSDAEGSVEAHVF